MKPLLYKSFPLPNQREGDKGGGLPNKKLMGVGLNKLKVNCYSGHTYAERPKSFLWEGIEYEVNKIERAWQERGEKHFQIRTKDNKLFNLCYNETEKEWSLIELVGG